MPDTQGLPARSEPATEAKITAQIVAIVTASFACYLAIGIPLATLPGYVHLRLGYGTIAAGLAVSVQSVATLVTRPRAGQMSDAIGAKPTVLRGLAGCAASGLLLVGAGLAARVSWASMTLLLASRLALGFGESCVATGAIAWGIGRVGPDQTARVISWNGIATYSAIAVGAPLGVAIERFGGFAAAGGATVVLALAALGFAWTRKPAGIVRGERMPFRQVFSRIAPYGIGLGLGSMGFGAIASFVALFYASRHWHDAAAALTAFGACFVGCRFLFANGINRHGGYRVAVLSFAVECAGLFLLCRAGSPLWALAGAAATGFGFSLVFPALGVEAISSVTAQSRGAALGAYAAFFDLALGITGPLMGFLVSGFGYSSAFLAVSAAAGAGGLLTLFLWARSGTPQGPTPRRFLRILFPPVGA